MKVICYANSDSADELFTLALEKEGYEVLNIFSPSELAQIMKESYMCKSTILYHVNEYNFNECYKSLKQLKINRPNILLGPQIIVIGDQSLKADDLNKFSNLSEDIIINPINTETILQKIKNYNSNLYNKVPSNDNDERISELLYVMKSQLISIRNMLINNNNYCTVNINLVSSLQNQLLTLNKYLTKDTKSIDSSFINVTNLLRKTFAAFGWKELNHQTNTNITKVEANYEYFTRAMEDLIEKLISIAGNPESLIIQEIINKDYLVINFTIKNLQIDQPQRLLDYKNFDFCQKVLNLHAGDFFIKFDHNLAYITCRVPISF